MPQLKVGDTIYHEDRYWKTDDLRPDEVPGWNAEYVPFKVVRITASTIFAQRGAERVQFPRRHRQRPGQARWEMLETDGKQYHSRFHEYFYAEIPKRENVWSGLFEAQPSAGAALGLSGAYTAEDVNRAYKRLARQHHPDAGGSHEAFVKLKRTRDEALKGVGLMAGNGSGRWRCSCGASMDLAMSGMWSGVGAHLVETFLGQHRAAGHNLTRTA